MKTYTHLISLSCESKLHHKLANTLYSLLDGYSHDSDPWMTPLVNFFGGNVYEIEEDADFDFMVAHFGTTPDIVTKDGPFVLITYINNNAGGPTFMTSEAHYRRFIQRSALASNFKEVESGF